MVNSFPAPDNFIIDTESLHNALFLKKNVRVSMLRLDKMHPMISGNKIFKLHYFLDEAINSTHKQVITFGGAYSNHLAATAFACSVKGLKSIGIVRGEKPPELSHTLSGCIQNGMQLEFISRLAYKKINNEEFQNALKEKYGDHTLIPEGGYSLKGALGAKLIPAHFSSKNFTHICCPVGTATTFAGLVMGCEDEKVLTGFSVLKNLNVPEARLRELTVHSKNYSVNADYHFGGYAKKTGELIDFINNFYKCNKIPLDFVYTGKMMFGVYDLINKNFFPFGANILCVHTGGLQGNGSLPGGTLNF